ncbi:MAG TPA: chromate transporter [Candidatus Binataceae bacterium]|nr:chromate transporter [Candidatus Binataceae bacterium]
MNKLITLVNVFALLSILAVGGGTAVLPQMKHDTVTTHHWLTAEQFTDIYSLGQLAPGPNMNMVNVIGYHVAGIPGAILVLLAFYVPSCTLVFAVGKFWDHFEGSPWRDAVQRGMAPITIGLMSSGVFAIGRTATIDIDRSMRFNLITAAITASVTLILLKRHINPALLILAGGAAGWLVLKMM